MKKALLPILAGLLLIAFPACKKKEVKKYPVNLLVEFQPSNLRDAYITTVKYSWTPSKGFNISDDYWVFVHFWDVSTKTMYFLDDHKPPIPFSKWEPGKIVSYQRTFVLPEYIEEITKKNFPVDFTVGFYNPKTGDKITVFKKRLNIQINPEVVPQIIFGEGWYSEEFDKEGKTWRWMGKTAVCRIENPKKTSLLYISGFYPEPILKGQKIRVYINDKVLDEITASEFKKVYTLEPSLLGQEDEFELKIEAEKTFVPQKVYKNSKDTRELSVAFRKIFLCVK